MTRVIREVSRHIRTFQQHNGIQSSAMQLCHSSALLRSKFGGSAKFRHKFHIQVMTGHFKRVHVCRQFEMYRSRKHYQMRILIFI